MITSYNFTAGTYQLLNGANVVDVFYLRDTYLSEPAIGGSGGTLISEDNGKHSRVLSLDELDSMGFASVALFTAQFDADKASNTTQNTDEGGTAALVTKSMLVTDAALGASTTKVISVAVPDGAVILGAQLNVDLAVTTSGGDDTFDAAFSGGDTTVIATAIAGTLDTKVDKLFIPILTTGVTNITVTAGNAENFATGTIQAIVYYRILESMADA